MRYVTLIPTFRGPTAGYQAVLVEDHDDDFRDELRFGPWSDALLVARAKGIDWAKKIGEPLEPGF